MAPEFQFPENAFTLHLFLKRLQRLIDIVVTNENLHALSSRSCLIEIKSRPKATLKRLLPERIACVHAYRHKIGNHPLNHVSFSGVTRVACPILRPGRASRFP